VTVSDVGVVPDAAEIPNQAPLETEAVKARLLDPATKLKVWADGEVPPTVAVKVRAPGTVTFTVGGAESTNCTGTEREDGVPPGTLILRVELYVPAVSPEADTWTEIAAPLDPVVPLAGLAVSHVAPGVAVYPNEDGELATVVVCGVIGCPTVPVNESDAGKTVAVLAGAGSTSSVIDEVSVPVMMKPPDSTEVCTV